MKLYAIRDKETGALADYVQAGKLSKDSWVLDKRFGVIWSNDGGLAFLAKDLSDTLNAKLEVITLRIEPTEPCEWCETYGGEMIALDNEGPPEKQSIKGGTP